MHQAVKGIFQLLHTSFDEDGDLNEEILCQEIEFCIEAGAHGLVMPVLDSEFFLLSDDERTRIH